MVIQSTRFGELKISKANIIRFPQGLPGFPDEKQFAFFPYEEDGPFAFLQSTADPDLSFMIVDPFVFFIDYSLDLVGEPAQILEVSDSNIPQVFNIVTVPEKVEEMTANLLAPIIVNWQQRQAMQIVLEKTAFTTRHRLFPNGFPKQTSKGGE